MKFGIFSLPAYIPEYDGTITNFYRRLLELLEHSEEAGFDSAWINEHHFHAFGGMMPYPPVALAAVAARTSHIRLGTSVAILPLHNPVQLAEAYAMLDQISEGRLEFGVGRGYLKHDYDVLGVPWDEGHDRMFEGLQVILEACSTSRSAFTAGSTTTTTPPSGRFRCSSRIHRYGARPHEAPTASNGSGATALTC